MTAMSPTSSVSEGASTAYLKALLDGDRRRAFGVVDRAREVGLELATIYLEVFQPALREIGRLWQENKISVADEHLATAITQGAMARLFEQEFSWKPGGTRSLIAACADSERHEVGLRMLCDMLEMEGWDTTFLGSTVPIEALVRMVEQRRPDVVAISASISPNLPRVASMVEAIRAAIVDPPPLVIVGGRPFLDDSSLAARLGADLTARDAAEAVLKLLDRVPHG